MPQDVVVGMNFKCMYERPENQFKSFQSVFELQHSLTHYCGSVRHNFQHDHVHSVYVCAAQGRIIPSGTG